MVCMILFAGPSKIVLVPAEFEFYMSCNTWKWNLNNVSLYWLTTYTIITMKNNWTINTQKKIVTFVISIFLCYHDVRLYKIQVIGYFLHIHSYDMKHEIWNMIPILLFAGPIKRGLDFQFCMSCNTTRWWNSSNVPYYWLTNHTN